MDLCLARFTGGSGSLAAFQAIVTLVVVFSCGFFGSSLSDLSPGFFALGTEVFNWVLSEEGFLTGGFTALIFPIANTVTIGDFFQ